MYGRSDTENQTDEMGRIGGCVFCSCVRETGKCGGKESNHESRNLLIYGLGPVG
jgi:hypothetical protein